MLKNSRWEPHSRTNSADSCRTLVSLTLARMLRLAVLEVDDSAVGVSSTKARPGCRGDADGRDVVNDREDVLGVAIGLGNDLGHGRYIALAGALQGSGAIGIAE